MRKKSLDCVYKLATADDRVVFVGSDLGAGVLNAMKEEMPERWFMEGVAEQHIIGMAAGLAMEGFIPYVNTIATFLTRRCFEQLVIDVGLHNLPVRLIANGGGVVYAPLGPTHQAIEDFAILRAIPNMTIVAPCDASEMERLMPSTVDWPGPIYIRLAKGGDAIVSEEKHGFEIGKSILLREPGDVLFVSTGIMTQRALKAIDDLKINGFDCGLLHMHTVKPLDRETLLSVSKSIKMIVTLEEHILNGGLGTAIIETLNDYSTASMPRVLRLGLPNRFVEEYGSQDDILNRFGLSFREISNRVQGALNQYG